MRAAFALALVAAVAFQGAYAQFEERGETCDDILDYDAATCPGSQVCETDTTSAEAQACLANYEFLLTGGALSCFARTFGLEASSLAAIVNSFVVVCGGTEIDESNVNYADNYPDEDSTDCAPGCPPNWPGDNFCDYACNNEACNFDNGDCEGDDDDADDDAYACADACGEVYSEYWYPNTCDLAKATFSEGGCAFDCPAYVKLDLMEQLGNISPDDDMDEECTRSFHAAHCLTHSGRRFGECGQSDECSWDGRAGSKSCVPNVCEGKRFRQCRMAHAEGMSCVWHGGQCVDSDSDQDVTCYDFHYDKRGCITMGCDWRPQYQKCMTPLDP